MVNLRQLLLSSNCTIAVVGATDDLSKFGGIIYRDLKSKGYGVFAVNPQRPKVDGDPCYPILAALPKVPSIVNFVVPPLVTMEILETCLKLGYKNVWLQPGSEDQEVMVFLKSQNFNYLAGPCIMVEAP